jgi:hypothetical protein
VGIAWKWKCNGKGKVLKKYKYISWEMEMLINERRISQSDCEKCGKLF